MEPRTEYFYVSQSEDLETTVYGPFETYEEAEADGYEWEAAGGKSWYVFWTYVELTDELEPNLLVRG